MPNSKTIEHIEAKKAAITKLTFNDLPYKDTVGGCTIGMRNTHCVPTINAAIISTASQYT